MEEHQHEDGNIYRNLRDVPEIKELVGKRILDVGESDEGEPNALYLILDDATEIRVYVDETDGRLAFDLSKD